MLSGVVHVKSFLISGSCHINCLCVGYPSPRGPVCYNCKNLPPEAPCHQIGFCETEEVSIV